MLELNLDVPYKLLTGEELKPDHISKFVANELSIAQSNFHPLRVQKICLDLFNEGRTSVSKKEAEDIRAFVESLEPAPNNITRTPFGKAQVMQLIDDQIKAFETGSAQV